MYKIKFIKENDIRCEVCGRKMCDKPLPHRLVLYDSETNKPVFIRTIEEIKQLYADTGDIRIGDLEFLLSALEEKEKENDRLSGLLEATQEDIGLLQEINKHQKELLAEAREGLEKTAAIRCTDDLSGIYRAVRAATEAIKKIGEGK